jgi:Spondin_N
MNRGSLAACILACAVVVAGAACKKAEQPAQQATAMGGADYKVVVKSTWTAATHPFEYPEAGVLTGPHFSGLIGASHNANYSIFAEGTPPTPGLEHLSEEGKHTPLDQEIQAAVAAGNAGMLVETDALRNFNDSLIAVIHVDSLHPLVSMVMMVAPSPDWFTGISSVNMMENGQWAATRTFDLIGWDSGGDDGTTYKAPDQDTNPKKPTSRANTPHFVINGTVVPVGTLTLTRM